MKKSKERTFFSVSDINWGSGDVNVHILKLSGKCGWVVRFTPTPTSTPSEVSGNPE